MKVANQQIIKGSNMKKIFTLIRESEGISRAKLARLTNLSKVAVSTLVEELINTGFVTDKGAVITNKMGRHSNMLVVNGKGKAIMVFHWLPKEVEARLINLDDSCLGSIRVAFAGTIDYVKETQKMFNELAKEVADKTDILGVCIISPTTVDPNDGVVLSSILAIPEDDTVFKSLRAVIPTIPLAFFNDTACFAYAELPFMQAEDSTSRLFLNLNKGIGAIILSGEHMLGGASGNTTEFGHFSVDRYGERCECGNHGCLENRVGEKALNKRAEEFGLAGIDKDSQVTYKSVAKGLYSNEDGYQEFCQALAGDLAFAIGNLITVHNLQSVIIGGRGQVLGEGFLDMLKAVFPENGFHGFIAKTELRYSERKPEDKSEFVGAAKYFFARHFSFTEPMEQQTLLN